MELISGLHRLEAFRARGREEILACLIDVTDLQAAMVEIDEKLMRTEPIAFERSEAKLSTEPRHADEVLAPLMAAHAAPALARADDGSVRRHDGASRS
ncbi:hypothetical protein WMF27_41370 [Sorangium sp. So ce281]|uniref:hypothetical protein n=1 Tax=unclassified Sorangium TaxID=2621164 RepID=UPI003F6222EE